MTFQEQLWCSRQCWFRAIRHEDDAVRATNHNGTPIYFKTFKDVMDWINA